MKYILTFSSPSKTGQKISEMTIDVAGVLEEEDIEYCKKYLIENESCKSPINLIQTIEGANNE